MTKLPNPPIVIILAAGEGARIGTPKAILKIKGRCFLEWIIDTLIIAEIDHILVVLGAEAERIKSYTDLSIVDVVINHNFENGQFSSLMVALEELDFPGDIIVFPVDHPLVEPETIIKLAESTCNSENKNAVIPVYKGQKGQPVLIRRHLVEKILSASPESNLHDIIWKEPSKVKYLKVDDPGILSDINTLEDYRELKRNLEQER